MKDNVLDTSFFEKDALELAQSLLGKKIKHGSVVIRILETEAYMPKDSACHAFKGQTDRNKPMFGAAGHLYVYLCYGIHRLLNVVSGESGSPQAVLIRAAEVCEGHALVKRRRGGRMDLIGPGKLTQALGIDVSFSGEPIGERVLFYDAPTVKRIERKKRVGIEYAQPKDRDALWRYLTPSSQNYKDKNTP